MAVVFSCLHVESLSPTRLPSGVSSNALMFRSYYIMHRAINTHRSLRDAEAGIRSTFTDFGAQCRYHLYTWSPRVMEELSTPVTNATLEELLLLPFPSSSKVGPYKHSTNGRRIRLWRHDVSRTDLSPKP